jgi:hypothetical protein
MTKERLEQIKAYLGNLVEYRQMLDDRRIIDEMRDMLGAMVESEREHAAEWALASEAHDALRIQTQERVGQLEGRIKELEGQVEQLSRPVAPEEPPPQPEPEQPK